MAAQAITPPSWPGLSGPSVAAGAGGDGLDKPDHDDKGNILLRPHLILIHMGLAHIAIGTTGLAEQGRLSIVMAGLAP
jgi:hypothetical protein